MESMIEWNSSSAGAASPGQDGARGKAAVVALTMGEFVDCLLAATAESASPDVSTPAAAWPAN